MYGALPDSATRTVRMFGGGTNGFEPSRPAVPLHRRSLDGNQSAYKLSRDRPTLLPRSPRMNPRPTLYILDSFSLIYQVFHAIPLMTSPAGQPVHAVFGVFRDLLNLLKSRKPDYLAAAFDGPEKTKRAEAFADYKAQRGPMPEDMVPQIPMIRRLFGAFRVPVMVHAGAEADDVIATLARRAVEKGLDVVICTADKDARQLLNDHIRILNLRKGEFLDVEGLKADWGVRPDQVVDTLALTGDAVDNVPGVPGIGLKTAVALLQEFDTIEGIMGNLDKVSGAKRKQNLKDHAETVQQGRRLITLDEDLPLELDWAALKSDGYDAKAMKALCQECGFHRFLEEIVDTEEVIAAPWDVDYRLVDTPEKLREFAEALSRGSPNSASTPRRPSIDPLRANPVGFSFAWEAGRGVLLASPGAHGIEDPPARDSALDAIRPAAHQSRGREGRPEPQVRHAGTPAGSGWRCSARSPTR